ncbi:MAG: PH domain-containing protein [Anaerolineae bacterium]|nr:PH domain-containing protein [Candidatus Roseilinea sp.]MDW8450099.1 PH domain-containing protein [Anaerolineae bacterium]
MNVFEVDSRLAFTSGVIAAAIAVFGAIASAIAAVLVPLSGFTFLFAISAIALLALAAWLGYQTYQLAYASYSLDRNAFVIRWGALREVVPMGDVQRVIAAEEVADKLRLLRAPLPGWWFGAGSHPALGKVRFYATEPPERQIIVVTPECSYAVSPYDDEAFVDAFRIRLEMRPTQNVAHARLLPGFANWRIWRDKTALTLLILAIALNLALFGFSAMRFPAAPAQIALHFDASGSVDRLGEKSQLFVPPVLGLLTLAVSLIVGLVLYRKGETLAAFMLWGGSAATQLLFFVAALTLGFTLPS